MHFISRAAIALLLLGAIYVGSSRVPAPGNRLSVGQTYCMGSTPCVLTAHNDNNRDGTNPHETILQATKLNATHHPTPRWMANTDAPIYTQPLYVHQLTVNGVAKNVAFVATEGNSVYAFDSDSASTAGTVLAQANLNDASDLGSGVTEIAVPYTDLPSACSLVAPEVGITGTPVIDVSVTPPVMYVVTKHEDIDSQGGKTYRQKLHGLYADTLQEIPGSPYLIDSNFASQHAPRFDPLYNHQRAGLTLVTGANNTAKIWVSWASNCDRTPYFGLEMAFTYNYTPTPGFAKMLTVSNAESSCQAQPCMSGIWMGNAAPAADAGGNVYFSTGNGADEFQGAGEYSNSILKVSDKGLVDFYSPPDYHALNVGNILVACSNPNPPNCPPPCALDTTGQYCQVTLLVDDWDLSGGGVVLLAPTFALPHPEIVATGKQGMIYTAFADHLGHMDGQTANSDKYACMAANAPAAGTIAQCFQGFVLNILKTQTDSGMRGAPAFLAGGAGTDEDFLYGAGLQDVLKAYQLVKQAGAGVFNTTPKTPASAHVFKSGTSPSVTWNNTSAHATNAIVWAIDPVGAPHPGKSVANEVLFAYRAVPSSQNANGALGAALWDTTAYAATNPGNPGAVKFPVPTVVDGKIFLGGGAQNYSPATPTCPVPTATVQPTTCGGFVMYQ